MILYIFMSAMACKCPQDENLFECLQIQNHFYAYPKFIYSALIWMVLGLPAVVKLDPRKRLVCNGLYSMYFGFFAFEKVTGAQTISFSRYQALDGG